MCVARNTIKYISNREISGKKSLQLIFNLTLIWMHRLNVVFFLLIYLLTLASEVASEMTE